MPQSPFRTRFALAALLWTLLTLGLGLFYYRHFYPGDLVNGDAMDFAQIARNIAAGHGFSTSIFRPLALSGIVAPQGVLALDVSRPPLYPLVLSFLFDLHGGHGGGNVVVMTSLFFFFASVLAVYRLARLLLPAEGSAWPALLTAGLYVLGGGGLGYAVSGLPVTFTTLLVTLLLIAVYRAHEVGGRPVAPGRELLVGLLLGLCYLTQYSLLVLTVPTLVYIFASRAPARSMRGVGLCVLGFFLVTIGWFVRNARVTHGDPFFTLLSYGLMANTPDYPGASTIYRSVLPSISPFAFFFTHLGVLLAKAGRNLAFYQTNFIGVTPILVLGPALVSLLWRFPETRLNALRGYAVVCLLLLMLGTAFFAPTLEVLFPFAPILTVLGMACVLQILHRQNWSPPARRITLWIWGGALGLNLLAFLIGSRPATLNPVQNGISLLVAPAPQDPALNERLRQEIARGATMTDVPWEVTWRTGLPALWLPRDNQAYEAVVARTPGEPGKVTSNALLLTPGLAAYNVNDGEAADWLRLSTHPQAWEQRNQALQNADLLPQAVQGRIAQLRKMMAAHQAPLARMTPAQFAQQVAQLQQTLPARIRVAKDQIQSNYNTDYGGIAEIMADFGTDPRVLQRSEANNLPSTLFVRRAFVKTLQ